MLLPHRYKILGAAICCFKDECLYWMEISPLITPSQKCLLPSSSPTHSNVHLEIRRRYYTSGVYWRQSAITKEKKVWASQNCFIFLPILPLSSHEMSAKVVICEQCSVINNVWSCASGIRVKFRRILPWSSSTFKDANSSCMWIGNLVWKFDILSF